MSQKYTIKQVVRILRKYEEFITLRCEAEKSLTYLFAQGNGQNYDERLRKIDWNFKDSSRRPTTIHYKINSEIENKIINIRNQTGLGRT